MFPLIDSSGPVSGWGRSAVCVQKVDPSAWFLTVPLRVSEFYPPSGTPSL